MISPQESRGEIACDRCHRRGGKAAFWIGSTHAEYLVRERAIEEPACRRTLCRWIRQGANVSTRQPTIAIVNNEHGITTSLATYLEREGLRVRRYFNTRDALELVDNPADLALLDKTNPPLGGLELYRRIRARHDMPVVFLSAWADEVEQELRGTGSEAQSYIQQPVSHRHVLDVVRKVLTG